ncbi:MAG: ATP-binding protein [Flavitalea sp.]
MLKIVKRINLAFIVLVLSYPGSAQDSASINAYSDSILNLARNAGSKDQKFQHYLDLSFHWSDWDTAKAFGYINEAKNVAGNQPTEYQAGLLANFTANIVFMHDVARAKALYMQADKHLSNYTTPEAWRFRSKAWNNYGILLQMGDSAEQYMNIITDRAIPYARKAGDSLAVGNGYLNIGLLLSNVQDHANAAAYFERALASFSSLPDAADSKLTVFVHAAKTKLFTGQSQLARIYLDSAAKQFRLVPHSTFAAHYYRTEGLYYREVRNKTAALEMFLKAIGIGRSMKDDQLLRDTYYQMYALHRDFGEYEAAKKSLLQANTYDAAAGRSDKLLHLREMAFVNDKLGLHKDAYQQMVEFAKQLDSLNQRNTALKLFDLEKKYKTVEKENQILRLQDVNLAQQSTIASNNTWIIVLVSGFLVALLIGIMGWMLARNHRRRLQQKELLHQQELRSVKQQEQLSQYRSVVQVQEEERNRIARDLHDGLGGLLAGVKLRLSTIVSRERNPSSEEEIRTVIAGLDHSSNELRRISRNMMPESLLYMGLEPALEDLCRYLSNPLTAIRFQAINLQSTYPQAVLINVYRIIQELLSNALKHAKASQVIVQVSDGDGHLFLTVEDNGKGMAESISATRSSGLGLKSIENRVALLKGRLEIDSHVSHGTTTNIEIPLDYERQD